MTHVTETEIRLEYMRDGQAGVVRIFAKRGDEVLHADTLDPAKASARKRFVKPLIENYPALDGASIERELMCIAEQLSKKSDSTTTQHGGEVEPTCIVRSELFHTHDVSGIAVPVTTLNRGQPTGRWTLYLRWHADGRRERRDLSTSIELPNAGTLWLFPQPGDPMPTSRVGWSAAARKAWLDGASAPDPVAVFKRLCEMIAHYIDLQPEVALGATATLALWTMFTYVYVAWPSVPYFSVLGPMESGKTTLFAVLARMCFRPIESASMTAACLFRTLHDCGGTLLLDEAERLKEGSPDAGELRAILQSGYKRGASASRLEKVGDGFRRTAFEVFGPKAFAAIGSLPEPLVGRCIRLTMFRAGPDSPKPRRRLDANPIVWTALRSDLHALALDHGPTWLELANRHDCCPTMFSGRQFELWQPLLALADWLDASGLTGLRTLVAEFAEQSVETARDDAIPESDDVLLRIVGRHVAAGTHRLLKAGDVLREACESDAAIFGAAQSPRWSAKGVSTVLRRYGLCTRKGSGNAGKIYADVTIEQLRNIERAYGFDLGLPSDTYRNVSNVPQTALSEP